MKEIFGPTSQKPFAQYDPNTQSWKMSEDISVSDSKKFSKTFPTSGTMRNGKLYQQAPLVRHKKEKDSLSWPTPRSCSAMSATINYKVASNPKRFPNLETVIGRRMKSQDPGGKMNPTWVEWLMGFPLEWTDLKD